MGASKLPELRIGKHVVRFPVVQAGMGVRVGTGKLAGTVINEGGIGVIASVGLGGLAATAVKGYIEESNRQLVAEIREARRISKGKGLLGVNVMVALTNCEELVRKAVDEGVDLIISGAGLPLRLPGYVNEKVALVPVVSSGRAAELLLRYWKKKYNRIPDAIILEGPFCGGHLGFTTDQIEHPETCSLGIILRDTKKVLAGFGEAESRIPLIAAEGVNTREDIERFISMGFQGVQIGTRFICMEESGMAPAGQEIYIRANKEDIVVVQSPVGLPVRVLKTPLVERIIRGGKEKFTCNYRCLHKCDIKSAPFCIAKALLLAYLGDYENGLFMTGSNVEDIKNTMKVHDFFQSLS